MRKEQRGEVNGLKPVLQRTARGVKLMECCDD